MGHDEPKYTETSASQWWREGWGVYTLSKDSKVKRLSFVLDILHGHALLLFSYNPCIESAQVALCPFGTQVYLKFYTQLGHLSVVTCSSLDECMLIWIFEIGWTTFTCNQSNSNCFGYWICVMIVTVFPYCSYKSCNKLLLCRLAFPEENNGSLKKIPNLSDPAQYSRLGLVVSSPLRVSSSS